MNKLELISWILRGSQRRVIFKIIEGKMIPAQIFQKAKLINKMPKLICVQAENSDAIHRFIQTGKYQNATNPKTIADSISVSTPSNAFMAKRAVEETDGFSVTVTDDEILNAQTLLASTTGIFAEPAAAATVAGLQKIGTTQQLNIDEQIVLLITGNGLKDIDAALKKITFPEPLQV